MDVSGPLESPSREVWIHTTMSYDTAHQLMVLILFRSAGELQAFVGKIMVYAISDQDDAGPWIRRHFPRVRFVVSVHGENVYMGAT